MQIVSSGDNMHEMPNSIFWENKKNISKCLKFFPACLAGNNEINLDYDSVDADALI